MSFPQAIFMSAFVLAIAIVMASYAPVVAQGGRAGYMVASDGRQFVWRVNTVDGSLTYCARFDSNTNESNVERAQPYCSSPVSANH